MKVLAIIVTYNGIQWYHRCFSSLDASTIPLDVFVVDNASSDDTISYMKNKFPKIKLVESPVNLGFGQANNKGIKYALENGYDYVFLLNQDAWLVEPDTIEQLVKAHINNPDYGIVSPMHLYGSGEKVSKGMKMDLVSHNYDSASDIISDLYFNRSLKEIYKVDFVCAAAWLVPCNVLKIVGGFDPIFFHYGEDDNYLQRIIYHGFSIGICPKVSICHDMEFRGGDYGKENNNWKKDLLTKFADINQNFSVDKYILRCLFKSVQQFFLLKHSNAITNFDATHYLLKNRKAIIDSRKRNIEKGFR